MCSFFTLNATGQLSSFCYGVANRSHCNVILQFAYSLRIVLPGLELHYQRVFDSEHRVIIQILAILVEYLCGDWLVSLNNDLLKSAMKIGSSQ